MVFAQCSLGSSRVTSEVAHLKSLVQALSYLQGIFCIDELPFIYMMTYSPQEYEIRLFPDKKQYENIPDEAASFLATLRLYLVTQNMAAVAAMLGIHTNSVKYRLNKALKYLGFEGDVSLNQIPHLKILTVLEHLVSENKWTSAFVAAVLEDGVLRGSVLL